MKKKILIISLLLFACFLITGNDAFAVTVYNETDFRNALSQRQSTITIRNSIDFYSAITIDYNVTINAGSEDNALRCRNRVNNFITVNSGKTLTLAGVVVDVRGNQGSAGITCIRIPSGAKMNFQGSLIDGGMSNTGLLIESGGAVTVTRGDFVYSKYGVRVQGNGTLTHTNSASMNFWNNNIGLLYESTATCNMPNSKFYNNTTAMQVSNGTVNFRGGSMYNNSYGAIVAAGTMNHTGGSIYNNTYHGVIVRNGTYNLAGGAVQTNKSQGVVLENGYSGIFKMTSGTISGNTNNAVYNSQSGDRCIIHGGTVSGYVYLALADNYVTTNTSYPTLSIRPSTYAFKRKLVKTDSNAYANNEISRVTMAPSGSWYKYVDGQYIVVWSGGNVIVKCVDEGDNTVLQTETKNGTIGTTVTLTDPTISGYALVTRPATTTLTYTQADQTVTYGFKKVSNLVIKYIDANTNEVLVTETVPLKEGDSYTASAREISGYQNTLKPVNETITMARADTELVYAYKKISDGVDVKYIDQVTGEEIVDTVHKDGLEKDTYTTEAKIITGYELVKTPDNTTGEMTVDLITVIYEYRKNSNVTVKYIDENYNTNLVDDIITKYKEEDPYTTEEKSFDGYVLTSKTDNTSGTVERTDIEVIYKYKKISDGVDVKYIDQATGLLIEDTVHLTGLEKDSYTTEAKDIDDYVLVYTSDNATGEMAVDLITVVYEYRMLSDVTTKFIDENYGTEIIDEVVETYKEGDPYTTKAKMIDGYVLTGRTDNTNGTIRREDIEVTYRYKKISEGVDTRFIDQVTGEEIATTVQQSGLEKDPYTTAPKEVSGYELVKTPDNTDGEMVVEKITVTYEYRLVSKVTTKYIDVNSRTEIVTAVENKYKEGDSYTTEEKVFDGYQLVNKTDNTSGTMVRSNIEVVYEYKKISQGIEVVFVDQVTGNPITASVVKTGLENEAYTTEPKVVEGYELVLIPTNASGRMTVGKITVKYEYRKLSDVVAKYIDVNYNEEITSEVRETLKEGDVYTTEEKSFEGYQLVNKTDNTSGTMVRSNIEVVYEYKKISDGVDIKYIDQVTGEEVADTEHKDGLEKDNYTTEPKEINGYELVKTPTNKNGEMTVDKITVTYEYRLVSKVITKHIDANTGKEIVEAIEDEYKEGDSYTTSAKDLVGYVITKTPQNKEGTIGRETIEVIYEYKKISDGLVVKYIDQITGDVMETETYTGNEEDLIQLEEKSYEGYILSKRPAVSEIKLTVEPQEVRFYYKKLININIIAIDGVTGEEIYTKVQTGVEGEAYETKPVILPGYEISKMPDNATGTYTREDVNVIYEYKRISEGVVVTYVDKDTREVLDTKTITGFVGEEYATEKNTYEKYDFVEVSGNPKGKLEIDQIEVTYYYSKKVGTVEIVYADEEGNELLKEELTGRVDEAFEIEIKEINNYRIKEVVGETEGVYTIEKQIVKFVMEKLRGKVIVNLLDQDGNLIGQLEEEDFVGEIFEVELPEKEGYYIDGDNKVTVEYIDGEIVINVNYIKIPVEEPPATGDINITLYVITTLVSVILIKKVTLKNTKN